MRDSAKALTVESVPPLVTISVEAAPVRQRLAVPELTYATPFAWAYVLRADEPVRQFTIAARGSESYSFSVTH